ncbi:MAG: HEPN domain-containing protein [Anaerolineales bacterium]|jgi:HEPN domain-containing protein
MSKVDSRIPADWFARAEKDLTAARHLLNEPEATFVVPAAMLLQQAVEKYLKGYLLSRGLRLKRTHDLLELLDEALPDAPELAHFDAACIKITEYYTEQRYPPLVTSDLSKEEVLQSLAEADELITEIKRLTALP